MLLAGAIGRGMGNRRSSDLTVVSLALTAGVLLRVRSVVPGLLLILGGSFVLDGFSFYVKPLVLEATALTVLLSIHFLEEGNYRASEYYSLLLLAASGMLFMASGYTLLTIWISLETMALASYVLAGYFKRERRSNEAALKYFILGAMSSGVLLYGISLLYGAAGTVQLNELSQGLAAAHGNMLVPLRWLLPAAGLAFQVAAVPSHVWPPRAYGGPA